MSTSRPSEVPSITGVPANLAEDQSRRLRQYLLQMGTRLVLIVTAALLLDGWLMWVCFAIATVLPYTAVLLVNAGRDRTTRETSSVPPEQPPELGSTLPAPDPTSRVVDHQDDETEDDTDRKDA